jgi:hypothetical protein
MILLKNPIFRFAKNGHFSKTLKISKTQKLHPFKATLK